MPSRRDPPPPSEVELPVAVLPIEGAMDLHGFAPRDVLSVVDEYLRAAVEKGLTEVRLIHGRGTGFQRQRVRELLAQHSLVVRFGDAPPHLGGWGATLVQLVTAPAPAVPGCPERSDD